MRFWDGKKSAKNRKNEQRWRPKATHRATFGWPGGMRGATGEGTMGRGQRSLHEFCMQCEAEFCRMLTCVRHALPRLEARGGGWRKRAFRRARFFLFVCLGGCGLGCLMRRGKVNKIKVGQTEVDAWYHTPWTKGSLNLRPITIMRVMYCASRLRCPL